MTLKLITAVTALTITASAAFAGPVQIVKTDIGAVLAASNGMTLYTFRKDEKGVSNCYDNCAQAWPPFEAKADAEPVGELGLVTRKDGSKQWALSGQPLYFWAGDADKGDTTGDGVGGVWDVIRK